MYEELGLWKHDSICKEYADTDAVPHYHFDIGLLHMQSIRWGIPCGVIIMRMILNGPIYDLLSSHITILGLIWEDVNVQSTM
jgi:hypothetical protein